MHVELQDTVVSLPTRYSGQRDWFSVCQLSYTPPAALALFSHMLFGELSALKYLFATAREGAHEELRGEVEEAGGRRRVWRGGGGGGGGEAARAAAPGWTSREEEITPRLVSGFFLSLYTYDKK